MSGPPSPSSLFSLDADDDEQDVLQSPAGRSAPPIPGLYVFPGLLDPATAHDAIQAIAHADHFLGGARDQVMLFTRSEPDTTPHLPPAVEGGDHTPSVTKLPSHLDSLLAHLNGLLVDKVPEQVHRTVFDTRLARQAILNLYPPGQGITPHVDLANRYADGIVGVSLTGSAVMDFVKVDKPSDKPPVHCTATGMPDGQFSAQGKTRFSVWLPPRSVYILSAEARWGWTHGIEGRTEDIVESASGTSVPETIMRSLRVSVTFRYLQRGGDVLA